MNQLTESVAQKRTQRATEASALIRRRRANEKKAAELRSEGYFVIRRDAVDDDTVWNALYVAEREYQDK